MRKALLLSLFVAACFAAPTLAQTADPAPLKPIAELSCDEMFSEMMVAGQQMNAQMDPSMAGNIQQMQADAQRQQQSAMTTSMGMSAICMIPGAGMACMAAQQAQAQRMQAQAAQNREQMNTVTNQVQQSMAGIDQERMMAVNDRWTAQRCEPPENMQQEAPTNR